MTSTTIETLAIAVIVILVAVTVFQNFPDLTQILTTAAKAGTQAVRL